MDSFSTSSHVSMASLSTPSACPISGADGKIGADHCIGHLCLVFLSPAVHSELFRTGPHTSILGLSHPRMHQVLPYLEELGITIRWTGHLASTWGLPWAECLSCKCLGVRPVAFQRQATCYCHVLSWYCPTSQQWL